MSQAGYTPISLYYSTTAAAAPSAANLANGELAINITDGKLYYKDNGGIVRVIAGKNGAGIAAGSNTQVQFNNSGDLGASSSFTWDGTTLSATKVGANNFLPSFTSTATAGGTTTLTGSSTEVQEFTGTLNQTIVLPVVSTLVKGTSFTIINSSTGVLTINSSGGNLINTLGPTNTAIITCILITGTTAASWSVQTSASGQMLGNAVAKAIFWNAQTISENITIGATQNGGSVGPVTISTGYAVTITSGGRWVIQ
jgi:hypothetical protein